MQRQSSRIFLPFFVFFTTLLVILAGCSKEPSKSTIENFVINWHSGIDEEIRDFDIISIGRCPSISSTASAKGVTDAYIVRYSCEKRWTSPLDHRGWISCQKVSGQDADALIYNQDGEWYFDIFASCP